MHVAPCIDPQGDGEHFLSWGEVQGPFLVILLHVEYVNKIK